MDTTTSHIEQISLIKYYLDTEERGKIETFSATLEGNAAPSIATLISLYDLLMNSSPLFRLKAIEICEGKHDNSIPGTLQAFFMRYMFKSKMEFDSCYPILAQMLHTALRV